jgi:hypothetical protein
MAGGDGTLLYEPGPKEKFSRGGEVFETHLEASQSFLEVFRLEQVPQAISKTVQYIIFHMGRNWWSA